MVTLPGRAELAMVRLLDGEGTVVALNAEVGQALLMTGVDDRLKNELMMGTRLEEMIGGNMLLIGKTEGIAVLFVTGVTEPWVALAVVAFCVENKGAPAENRVLFGDTVVPVADKSGAEVSELTGEDQGDVALGNPEVVEFQGSWLLDATAVVAEALVPDMMGANEVADGMGIGELADDMGIGELAEMGASVLDEERGEGSTEDETIPGKVLSAGGVVEVRLGDP